MHIMYIWPCFRVLTSKWPFLTPKMTSDDLEMHLIRIRIKFWIDWYAYHVHLATFPIFDPKMTFFDPSGDLGWPQDAHHWIQKKISNRSICISCIIDIKLMLLPFPPFSDRNPFITAMKLPETTHFRWFSTIWKISYHHISSDPPEITGHIENVKNSRDSRVEIKFW